MLRGTRRLRRALSATAATDADAAAIIQSHLFDSDDLTRLRTQELQRLLGRVDNATLARSLVDAGERVAAAAAGAARGRAPQPLQQTRPPGRPRLIRPPSAAPLGGRVVVEGEEQEGADSELQLDAGEVMRPKGPIDAVLEFPNAGGARVDVAPGAEVTGLSADGEERAPSAEKAGLYLRVRFHSAEPSGACHGWRRKSVHRACRARWINDVTRKTGRRLKCGLSMVRTWSGWVPVRECASTVG